LLRSTLPPEGLRDHNIDPMTCVFGDARVERRWIPAKLLYSFFALHENRYP